MRDAGPLFTPLQVGDRELPNRVVMPPMVVVRGLTRADGIAWYGEHAAGGAGLVIVEATAVNRFGTELTGDSLRPLVDAIHAGGALAAIQLFPVTFGDPVGPAALSRPAIDAIVEQYAVAAAECARAGFDGVEPHGAHGYLLNQFFAPERNARDDDYGGGLDGRMRLSLRLVRALRPVCDESGMMLLYRHTPVGPGYGMDDSLAFGAALVAAGVQVLDISPSSHERPGDRAAPFRRLGVPVIAVGQMADVERALEALIEGRADLIAVGRGLIADPEWPRKVREGRFGDLVECLRCDEGCFGNLRRGVPVECIHRS